MTAQPFDFQDLVPTVASQPSGGRFRLGVVQAVGADYTITVTVAGSSTVLSGVKYLGSYQPVPADAVWLVSDGLDIFALGMVAQSNTTYAPRVTRSSDSNHADSNDVTLPWMSVDNDPGGSWSVANATRLYAVISGTYMATCTMAFAGNATGYRRVTIYKGVTDALLGRSSVPSIGAGAPTYVNVATPSFTMTAGDYIYAAAWQNTGGLLAVSATNGTPNLTLIYLGP